MRWGWWIGVLLLVALGACAGGPPKRLFPPALSVAELRLEPAAVTLRLRSYATVPLRITQVRGKLYFDERVGIPIELSLDLTIAASATETLELRFDPPPELRQLLLERSQRGLPVAYRIEATVRATEPDVRFEVEHRSSLAPTPGLPGVLR